MNYRFLPAAEKDLLILAVMNLHRNPKRLKDRISV